MSLTNLILMMLCVAVTSLAQVILKIGTTQATNNVRLPDSEALLRTAGQLGNPVVLAGLGLYVTAAIIYLRVLREVDLNQAYPMVALSYVFTILAGILWLGEPMHANRIAGAALVLVGVGLIAWR